MNVPTFKDLQKESGHDGQTSFDLLDGFHAMMMLESSDNDAFQQSFSHPQMWTFAVNRFADETGNTGSLDSDQYLKTSRKFCMTGGSHGASQERRRALLAEQGAYGAVRS